MALEAIVPNYNDYYNLMLYEALNAPQYGCNFGIMDDVFKLAKPQNLGVMAGGVSLGFQGRKKKRRRPKICKNKQEAETQRMTHITVERNRRKQMNEHLAVLRSLMPESYAQRGDQASIVGGAIEFVKELEHLVHSLEVQKLIFSQRSRILRSEASTSHNSTTLLTPVTEHLSDSEHSFSQGGNKYTLKSKDAVADIEVTLIETHANLRILSKKSPRLLSRLVAGFHTLRLTILHLSVTTLDPSLALCSISAKVEEGCQLTSVDSIGQAILHMLRIIEQDMPFLTTTLAA